MDELLDMFQRLLDAKNENKGNDMLTYMLEEASLFWVTDGRFNDALSFSAGHDEPRVSR